MPRIYPKLEIRIPVRFSIEVNHIDTTQDWELVKCTTYWSDKVVLGWVEAQ
jgi:hypothetical protein